MLKLELPWPPSINHYWRHAVSKKRAVVYLSDEGRAYHGLVKKIASGAVSGRLRVIITAYPPDKRKRDLDNVQKALLDSLVKCGVIEDDSHIDDLRIVRAESIKDGKVVVNIETV